MRLQAVAAVGVAVLALAIAACGGESAEQKAKNQVCTARNDIGKQVDTLKGLTVSTATTSQIQKSLNAISNDLKRIQDAMGQLSAQTKKAVQEANAAFTQQVKHIATTLGSTTSASQAKSQLTTALQQLAVAYQQTFGKLNCSSS